eukprot:scaffold1236_cov170-Ochromonas_danica.AAC.18
MDLSVSVLFFPSRPAGPFFQTRLKPVSWKNDLPCWNPPPVPWNTKGYLSRRTEKSDDSVQGDSIGGGGGRGGARALPPPAQSG